MKYKQISVPSPHPRQLFLEWYHSTPSGQTLRDSEASYLLHSLQLTYCQRILQVSYLGTESSYITEEFRRNFILQVDQPNDTLFASAVVQANMTEWPIACESVDTLILPHLLEFEDDPHVILSEAERVLTPEGRLIILGFNPWSLQTLLRYRQESPSTWNAHCVGISQLTDWLNLLKFETEFSAGFGLSPALAFFEPQSAWQKSVAYLSAAYAIRAIKRTWTPIPIKPAWLEAAHLLPGQAVAPTILRKTGTIDD
jgi:SAM-dependent methyltransferase